MHKILTVAILMIATATAATAARITDPMTSASVSYAAGKILCPYCLVDKTPTTVTVIQRGNIAPPLDMQSGVYLPSGMWKAAPDYNIGSFVYECTRRHRWMTIVFMGKVWYAPWIKPQ
jgi:hypothetical protein